MNAYGSGFVSLGDDDNDEDDNSSCGCKFLLIPPSLLPLLTSQAGANKVTGLSIMSCYY